MNDFPIVEKVIADDFTNFTPYWGLTVFCQGCNFRCPECYNLANVTNPNVKTVSIKQVLDNNLTEIHDAVTILGGEPTIWGKGLVKALKFIKEYRQEKLLKTKLFTNGTNPKILKKCIPYLDKVSIDIKCIRNISKVANINFYDEDYLRNIDRCINLCKYCSIPVELRTTKWDCIMNVPSHLQDIKDYVSRNYPGIEHIIQEKFEVPKSNVL